MAFLHKLSWLLRYSKFYQVKIVQNDPDDCVISSAFPPVSDLAF